MNILISFAMFITIVLMIEGSYFAFRIIHNPEQRRIRRRLRTLSSREYGTEAIDIVRKRVLSEVPWFNKILLKAAPMRDLERILEQANSRYRVGVFLLLSILLAFIGLWLSGFVLKTFILKVFMAALWGIAPFFYIYRKKQQRMLKFQRQLPEALDLVTRALRAGHALMVGMKMVGDEFPDPIGAEFERTNDEINFGIGVPEALKNLSQRVDCPDLNFFVTSIIVQRETGGNLAEIVENLSHLIRRRFELQGRVRVLAAEGKLSAMILLALPFLVALAISFLNPDYLRVLFTDLIGKAMIGFGCLMMAIGAFVIRMMIQIRV